MTVIFSEKLTNFLKDADAQRIVEIKKRVGRIHEIVTARYCGESDKREFERSMFWLLAQGIGCAHVETETPKAYYNPKKCAAMLEELPEAVSRIFERI